MYITKCKIDSQRDFAIRHNPALCDNLMGDIRIPAVADSCCCTAETNTTLQNNYAPIKKKWSKSSVLTALFKMDNENVLLYSTGNSAQCYMAAWVGAECGGEWIHVYVWLSPFAVHWNYHVVNQLLSDMKLKIKKNPLCSAWSSLPPPTSGNQWSFHCLYSCTSSKSHIVGIVLYEAFAYWLISLSNFHLNVLCIFSRLDSSSLFFHCVDVSQFIYPFTYWLLSCFSHVQLCATP